MVKLLLDFATSNSMHSGVEYMLLDGGKAIFLRSPRLLAISGIEL